MNGQGAGPPAWETLFRHALVLIDQITLHGRSDPFWTFGGGTALMLRYGHRLSKDIDIFVPDPQSLGYVTPRLSAIAEGITADYAEAANYVKLYLPEGEIDFVASPNLTKPGYVEEMILGHRVRVETAVEIIAKKMWHRGDQLTGRDIFDFALVASREPEDLSAAAHFILRHARTILCHLNERGPFLRAQFDGVHALTVHPTFDEACSTLRNTLDAMQRHP